METLRFKEIVSGKTIKAVDGEIGQCLDLLFDERFWTARYLVVKTGTWFFGSEVLIPVISVNGIDADSGEIEVCITREEVENAPKLETDKPVSRQYEINISDHYAFGYYWAMGSSIWGPGINPATLRNLPEKPQEADLTRGDGDPHLRSITEITGYKLVSEGREIGSVAEAYVCPPNWSIKYLIVETGGWLMKRKTLVLPEWVAAISWKDKSISLKVAGETVDAAPDFKPPLTFEYESKLESFYGLNARRKSSG